MLAQNGGCRYGGYGEIVLRCLLRPKKNPRHPLGAAGITPIEAEPEPAFPR